MLVDEVNILSGQIVNAKQGNALPCISFFFTLPFPSLLTPSPLPSSPLEVGAKNPAGVWRIQLGGMR